MAACDDNTRLLVIFQQVCARIVTCAYPTEKYMSRLRIGVVMDPIADITPAKDSTLAMLLEAQSRGHELAYFEQADLRIVDGVALGDARAVKVRDDSRDWFELGDPVEIELGELDVILMRKDPPFDTEYIYTTYILERAELCGTTIVNRPASLRDINEKAFTAWFPQCCPPTLITRSIPKMREFMREQDKIVVKPMHGMGGRSIFVIDARDNNANVIFETLTDYNSRYAIAQKYIPQISDGDKRILLVDGMPARYSLARVPPAGEHRGNLVAGAQADLRELTDRDRWICSEVGPTLAERGVIFAGLDVIGDYLTEVNVTSPTGIREIHKLGEVNVAVALMESLEDKVQQKKAAA
jgi:glutathione synthase